MELSRSGLHRAFVEGPYTPGASCYYFSRVYLRILGSYNLVEEPLFRDTSSFSSCLFIFF